MLRIRWKRGKDGSREARWEATGITPMGNGGERLVAVEVQEELRFWICFVNIS